MKTSRIIALIVFILVLILTVVLFQWIMSPTTDPELMNWAAK